MKSSKSEAEKVLLGKIAGVHGIRGEVKVYSFGDAPSDFNKYEKALLVMPGDEEHEAISFAVEKARIQGSIAVVKFAEINDRNAAEELRNAEVYVEADDLAELPDDTYYVRDLEGLCVIDDETGEEVGVIAEVIQNTAQDVYRIVLNSIDEDESGSEDRYEGSRKEALVPAVKEFIKDVNVKSGTIRIHFIEGMR